MAFTTHYDARFFKGIETGSRDSARVVIPILQKLLQPKTVADVGCGAGAWLSVVRECGIQDVLGIDGDYVNRDHLLIPREQFHAADLGQPVRLDRRFDLVLSLEVAEHVPPDQADVYLDNLARLGDVIAFSAAVPNQTGKGHVNEQWPDYWKPRFEARGYVLIDCLRHRIWDNRDVERWYRQNLLLYVKQSALERRPVLQGEFEASKTRPLSIVHPAMYMAPSLKGVLHMIPPAITRAVRRRLRKP